MAYGLLNPDLTGKPCHNYVFKVSYKRHIMILLACCTVAIVAYAVFNAIESKETTYR